MNTLGDYYAEVFSLLIPFCSVEYIRVFKKRVMTASELFGCMSNHAVFWGVKTCTLKMYTKSEQPPDTFNFVLYLQIQ